MTEGAPYKWTYLLTYLLIGFQRGFRHCRPSNTSVGANRSVVHGSQLVQILSDGLYPNICLRWRADVQFPGRPLKARFWADAASYHTLKILPTCWTNMQFCGICTSVTLSFMPAADLKTAHSQSGCVVLLPCRLRQIRRRVRLVHALSMWISWTTATRC